MKRRRPLARPAARLTRFAGLALVGLALTATAFFVLLPLLSSAFVRSIELLVTGCVWLALSIGVGASVWDVLGTVGRAAGSGLASSKASIVLAVLVLVGIVALYFLQHLLESEEESSQ